MKIIHFLTNNKILKIFFPTFNISDKQYIITIISCIGFGLLVGCLLGYIIKIILRFI